MTDSRGQALLRRYDREKDRNGRGKQISFLKTNFTKKISTPHMQSITKLNQMKKNWIPASAGMTQGGGRKKKNVTMSDIVTLMKRGFVFSMVLMMVLSNVFMANAATYTFTQTNWCGGVTANNAVPDTGNNQAQQSWQQFSTSTASLAVVNSGADVQIGTAASSTTQSDEGSTVTGFALAGASNSQTSVSGSGTGANVQLATVPGQFGSGVDGAVTISTSKNINTDTIASGRTCADGISYNIVALTANTATLSGTPPAGCFAAGDKVMILNEQGYGTNVTNVGNYEFLDVQSISGNVITFTESKTKYYGNAEGNDFDYTDWQQVSAGNSHTSAVKTDGTLWAWGNNSYGQLGLGNTTSQTSPVQVGTGTNWQQVSAGTYHTMAVTTDGTLWAWGYNSNGQLGLGDTTQRTSPTQVGTGTNWASVSASVYHSGGGGYHTLAVKTDGTLWAWGNNSYGQLGLGDTTQRTSPTQVGTGTNWASVSAGGFHALAVKTDGTLWAWGNNGYGRLGDGTTTQRTSPVQIGTDTTWQSVSAGSSHTMAVKTGGTLWAWGYNGLGQLGLGDTTQRTSPVQVGTDTDWQQVSSGGGHNMAVKAGVVLGTGRNDAFQLGITYNLNRLVFTQSAHQKIVLQRIPQYTSVDITATGTITASPWNGERGGVLAFYASGNVNVQLGGSINVVGKGYRSGNGSNYDIYEGLYDYGYAGESYNDTFGEGYGGGDGYCSEVGGCADGPGGGVHTGVYGGAALSKIFMGAGGGEGGGSLGAGGGIVYISSDSLSLSGSISVNGGGGDANGGGAGGSAYLIGGSLTVGTNVLTSTGGTSTSPNANGGIGRIKLSSSSISGTTNPAAETSALPTIYYTSGAYISGAMDLGNVGGYTTLNYSASTTAQTVVTIDVRAGNTATPDGTWTAWTTGVSSGGDISALGANRYFQYRANLATSDNTQTPALHDVSVGYSIYATDQTLTSSKYDTSSADNAMGSIAWDEDASLPAGTTVTVSLRTAATEVALTDATWYAFTNASDDCAKVDTTVTCPSAALASASASLADNIDDQWYQYKVSVTSTGVNTPTIPEVRVQYVVNAPPELSAVTATQIATSSDANWGKIQINYSVRDIDSETGSITPGYVTPLFEYNIGGGWVAIDEANLSANALDNKIVTQIGYTAYSATWDVQTAIPAQYFASAQVRVTVDDNEPANNTAQATAAEFVLDTTAPTVSGTINGTSNELTYSVSDDQNVSYRLSNNSDGSYDSVNAASGSWVAAGAPSASATTTWELAGAPSNQIAYLEGRDVYGNTASTTIIGPSAPTYFDLKDASNVLIDNYQIFLSWKVYTATTSASFNRYELYRSTDGYTYGLRSTITDSATNYYTNTGLASSTTYYYKLLAVDSDGDVSPYSTVLSHQPSGQGGTDSTSPTISLVTATDTQSTYAKITFTTNELAFGTVEYHAEGGSPYALSETKDTIATAHTIVLTDLTPNTTYTYRVQATDIAGNETTDESLGAGYTFTTRGGPIITDVTAILADDRNATVAWNTNVDSNSTLVYAENAVTLTNGVGTTAVQDTSFAGGAGPLYQHRITLTSLTPRTTYYYYVQSTDIDGNTGVDKNGLNYYTFTTSYDTKAPTVSNITTPVITETAVVVLWKTDELSDSQVSYGTESGTYTETTTLDTNMSIVHAVTLTGLTAGTDYYYVVKSNDPAGNATTSPEQSVTSADAQEILIVTIGGGGAGKTDNPPPDVKDTAPAAISNIKIVNTTAFGATLSFETNEPTVIGLRYGQTTAYDRAEASIDWKLSHEIKLSGLRLGTDYHFQIKAIDKGGNEAFSDDTTFTTKFIAEASESARTIENIQQYEQEIEDSLASILPSILPPFVEDARVTDITESAATINWRTNINSYATVSYATEEEYLAATTTRTVYTGEVSDISAKTREHSLILIGLKPNTTYHFKAKSFSVPQVVGEGRDMTFITKAPAVQASVIDVKTSSFRAAWTTDVAASSIVEYKNLTTGVIERIINEPLVTYHDILVDNLRPGTRYEVKVLGYSASGNLLSSGTAMNVLTSTDIAAPKIGNFKVDGALVPGRTDRIQTIVSWTTDEPGTGIVEYQEGAGSVADGFANKVTITDSYVTNHVVILANLKPGTIYQFKITSADQAGNTASFGPRTIITPQKGESIFDVIFKNFEDTFKFLRGAGQ